MPAYSPYSQGCCSKVPTGPAEPEHAYCTPYYPETIRHWRPPQQSVLQRVCHPYERWHAAHAAPDHRALIGPTETDRRMYRCRLHGRWPMRCTVRRAAISAACKHGLLCARPFFALSVVKITALDPAGQLHSALNQAVQCRGFDACATPLDHCRTWR